MVASWLQAAAVNGETDDGVAPGLARKRQKRAWEEDSDAEGGDAPDEEQTKRLAEEKDARERDEFAERLRQRDEAKTRKLAEAKLSKEELAVRL